MVYEYAIDHRAMAAAAIARAGKAFDPPVGLHGSRSF